MGEINYFGESFQFKCVNKKCSEKVIDTDIIMLDDICDTTCEYINKNYDYFPPIEEDNNIN